MFSLEKDAAIKFRSSDRQTRLSHPVYRLLPMPRKGGGVWQDSCNGEISGIVRAGNFPIRSCIMSYECVREAGQWKIDDIRGSSDGEPWSIRAMLAGSLKN
jgi:hypothetical protein